MMDLLKPASREAVSRLQEFRSRLRSARLEGSQSLFTVTFGALEAEWLELALGFGIEAIPLAERAIAVRRLLGHRD